MSNGPVRLSTEVRPQTAPTAVKVRTFPLTSDRAVTLGYVEVCWGQDFRVLFDVLALERVDVLIEALQEAAQVGRAFLANGGPLEQRHEVALSGLHVEADPYA